MDKNFKPRTTKVMDKNFVVFDGLCKGCGLCLQVCPQKALSFSKDNLGIYSTPAPKLNSEICKICRSCEKICPDAAITIEEENK